MASGGFAHQSIQPKGELVPVKQLSSLPLLPYEKQLIDLLGLSEEEYKKFIDQARRRGQARPAEYAYIPDIQNAPAVPALISLAVGIAATAVGYLLMPKPRAIATGGEPESIQQRQLASSLQGNRFAPTFGFDSQATLASYNDPIPVVFGRYTGLTGGVVVSPALVWSRMYSYGNQQAVKLLFIIGEQGRDGGQIPQGIAPPDLRGIFLGNGSLDSAFENNYAIYWKRNTTSSGYSRILASNLIYGTRGTPDSGDPETYNDVFTCPTLISDNDYGFSSAHSLSNNAEFGCYDPIPNGTAYRVNWRVVTIPRLEGQSDDPGGNLIYERIKIAGNGDRVNPSIVGGVRELYQSGTGRNYSRRMGIVSLNGIPVSDAVGAEERFVNVGDVAAFMISSNQIPSDIYSAGKVKVDDINSEIKEQCIAADDALQVGELFMIGRSVWKVISRKLQTWEQQSNQDQVINLQCVEIPEINNKIGIVSYRTIADVYIGDDVNIPGHVGIAYYPLTKVAFGIVRNTRECDVTEIGIRSRVFQRLNNLCNFQSIPTPSELQQAEENRVNLVSGVQNSYIQRASVFTIQLRPSGLDASGQPFPWRPLGMRFAVVNARPVDVYSYIRLKHPTRLRMEYRLVPKSGADLRNTPDSSIIWQLSTTGNGNDLLATNVPTSYGPFEVRSSGVAVTKFDLTRNPELTAIPAFRAAVRTETLPSDVGIQSYLPDNPVDTSRVSAFEWVGVYSDPAGFTVGRSHAFAYELFGGAGAAPIPVGAQVEEVFQETMPDGRWIKIRYRAQKVTMLPGHYSGRNYTWLFRYYWVEDSSGGWNAGEEFVVQRNLSANNPFRVVPDQGVMARAGLTFRITNVTGFNPNLGRAQALYEELFGPARSKQIGQAASLQTLDLTAGLKKIRISLRSYVYNDPSHWSGINRLWTHPEITVIRDIDHTSDDWRVGDTFQINYAVQASNPFYEYGQSVGAVFNILAVTNREVAPAVYDAERIFEFQSKYADISYYGNLIEKSNASSPEHAIVYVNEMVGNATIPTYENMTICGLSLRAGRNFTSLDQLRIWLPEGLHVRRFHPDDQNTPTATGPSNLFCDLAFYFLTNQVGGLGPYLGMSGLYANLVNEDDMVTTAKFLKTNFLFYDGVIGSAKNLRQFIADTAPFFLCNFIISDGRFSLLPALPTTASGQISTQPVTVKQLFTAGNIFEGSFELEYLDVEERKDFQAIMRYRYQERNQLPEERNVLVRWGGASAFAPVESFDMTAYCTSETHAVTVAKFFISMRRRVTHTISFATSPYGLNLAPGDYIKVVTRSSPYNPAKNGTISSSGLITSATDLANGQYQVLYYKSGSGDVIEATMNVANGVVTDEELYDSVFTVLDATISQNVYVVEQLSFSDDNTVTISASEFPCDQDGVSLIAEDITQDANYVFER